MFTLLFNLFTFETFYKNHEQLLQSPRTRRSSSARGSCKRESNYSLQLVSICSHDREQAEQCSVIIHHHGKCSVKIGEIDRLRPMCEALLDRGLSATIE